MNVFRFDLKPRDDLPLFQAPRMRRLAPLLVSALLAGCSGPGPLEPVDAALFARTLSVEEQRADVRELFAALEEVHPDPFHAVPREEFVRLLDESMAELDRPMTPVEAWPTYARLLALVGDAHTSVRFPSEVEAAAFGGGETVIPFVVDVGEECVVRRVIGNGGGVPRGAALVAINGRPLDALREEWRATTGQPDVLFRYELGREFARHVWRAGLREPFEVSWRAADDDAVEVSTMLGVRYDADRFGAPRSRENWRFEDLGDGIGLLEFNRMTNAAAFDDFLDETFARLRDDEFRGLVIDMRENSGGSSILGQRLIERFADRPFRMVARKEWRVSARMKEFLRSMQVPAALRWLPDVWQPFVSSYLDTEEGTLMVRESGWVDTRPAEERFTGGVCVLIGKRTFSSALMTVSAIGDCRLATLAGETTGDAPNHFGELCIFRLPRSGLQVRISSARFVRASGDAENRRGVAPQLAISGPPEFVRDQAVASLKRPR